MLHQIHHHRGAGVGSPTRDDVRLMDTIPLVFKKGAGISLPLYLLISDTIRQCLEGISEMVRL
jgi:hypothetical protein